MIDIIYSSFEIYDLTPQTLVGGTKNGIFPTSSYLLNELIYTCKVNEVINQQFQIHGQLSGMQSQGRNQYDHIVVVNIYHIVTEKILLSVLLYLVEESITWL